MGIPRLTQSLRPYAVPGSLSGLEVVIDGPGLAYHIWHICLGERRNARNPFEAGISYAEVGITVLAWLDALRQRNVSIRKIYFDGFLPLTKADVREKRLIRQTQQLSQFHETHRNPCRIPSDSCETNPRTLFPRTNVPSRLTELPPLPFLVPSILEALLASDKYGGHTEVVPGEADIYCSESVKNGGGVIVTGDSDLLVHDLGLNGAVVFFHDLEPVLNGPRLDLRAPIYRPAAISDRLGLPKPHGLQALAFEMSLSTRESFGQLLVQAKAMEAIKNHPDEYDDFKEEYDSSFASPREQSTQPETSRILQSLDPRISEYVLQYFSIATLAGQSSRTSLRTFISDDPSHVFLPFLLDCPSRTNAWEMAITVRQLAHGLMNLIVPVNEQKTSVFEHKRQESKSKGRELILPSLSQIPEACKYLVTLLSSRLPVELSDSLSVSSSTIWTAAAVYQDVEWSHNNSKTCLSQLLGTRFSPTENPSEITQDLDWDSLHLYAQIQGSYYSFRILKQILALVVSQKSRETLSKSILELNDILQTLPPLSSIPDITRAIPLFHTIGKNGMLAAAQKILKMSVPDLPSNESNRADKKKRKRDKALLKQPEERKKQTNPFALLDVE